MAAGGTILNESIVSVQTLGFSSMDQQLTTCFLPDGYNSFCNDIDDDDFISDDNDDIKRLFAGFPILDHLDLHYPISDDFDPRVFDIDQYPDETPLPEEVLLPDQLFESVTEALTTTTTRPFEYPASSHHHHHHHHNHHHHLFHPSSVSSLPLTLSPSTVEEVYGGFLKEEEEEEEEEEEKSRSSSSSSSSSSSPEFTNIPVFVESGSVSEDDEQDEAARPSRSRHAGSKFNNWENSNNGSYKYVVPRSIAEESTPPLTTAPRRVRRRKDQLWYFLLEILGDPEYNPNYIQWENKDQGIFRFIESKKVAQLWGAKKKRSGMTYEYFARAMRHYYSRGIMRRVTGRRLVYQFGPKAENWKGYAQQVTINTRSNQDDAGC